MELGALAANDSPPAVGRSERAIYFLALQQHDSFHRKTYRVDEQCAREIY